MKYVLADIEALEWKARHGYKYDWKVFLTLTRQHCLLYTRLKEFSFNNMERMMYDQKRNFDRRIKEIKDDLIKLQERHTKNEVRERQDQE